MKDVFRKYIYPFLPPNLTALLDKVPSELVGQINEIRIRIQQPLSLVLMSGDVLLDCNGRVCKSGDDAYICMREDVMRTLQMMSRHSIYALENELQQGFLTLPGGHRVGFAGQAIVESNRLRTMKNISSLNIRLAREILGSADSIMPYLVSGNRIYSTLIISPPRCGKTTILRDIARQLSSGVPALQFSGVQIGIVDERSEIAASIDGVPSMKLGFRTDVLDGCPKAQGMLMLIRSMAPGAIITDELGRKEDAEAVQEALHAGVAVVASVHGRNIDDILSRPYIGELVSNRWFDRFVILGKSPHPGIIEEICCSDNLDKSLYCRKKEVKVCG